MKLRKGQPLKEHASQISERLRKLYPDAHCELNFTNPLELLVATILSAQCTDKRVNIVSRDLFKKLRTAADYAEIPQEELEVDIKSTGFFRSKSKSLRSMAQDLVNKFDGKVPASMEELTSLAGVGRKTANVVLGNAFHINDGIVVDTHVRRLAQRLGLTRQEDPDKIESELMKLVPQNDWTIFSHWLIWHGRRCCYAQKPDCAHCGLATICPSFAEYAKLSADAETKKASAVKKRSMPAKRQPKQTGKKRIAGKL
jgi:endonuclease III